MRHLPLTIIIISSGFIYGLILTIIGIRFIGGGDGALIPICLFSEPLHIIAFILGVPIIIFAGPILWAIIGYLLSMINEIKYIKYILISILGTQYLSFLLTLKILNDDPWEKLFLAFKTYPIILILGFVIYLGGQIFIWYNLIKRSVL